MKLPATESPYSQTVLQETWDFYTRGMEIFSAHVKAGTRTMLRNRLAFVARELKMLHGYRSTQNHTSEIKSYNVLRDQIAIMERDGAMDDPELSAFLTSLKLSAAYNEPVMTVPVGIEPAPAPVETHIVANTNIPAARAPEAEAAPEAEIKKAVIPAAPVAYEPEEETVQAPVSRFTAQGILAVMSVPAPKEEPKKSVTHTVATPAPAPAPVRQGIYIPSANGRVFVESKAETLATAAPATVASLKKLDDLIDEIAKDMLASGWKPTEDRDPEPYVYTPIADTPVAEQALPDGHLMDKIEAAIAELRNAAGLKAPRPEQVRIPGREMQASAATEVPAVGVKTWADIIGRPVVTAPALVQARIKQAATPSPVAVADVEAPVSMTTPARPVVAEAAQPDLFDYVEPRDLFGHPLRDLSTPVVKQELIEAPVPERQGDLFDGVQLQLLTKADLQEHDDTLRVGGISALTEIERDVAAVFAENLGGKTGSMSNSGPAVHAALHAQPEDLIAVDDPNWLGKVLTNARANVPASDVKAAVQADEDRNAHVVAYHKSRDQNAHVLAFNMSGRHAPSFLKKSAAAPAPVAAPVEQPADMSHETAKATLLKAVDDADALVKAALQKAVNDAPAKEDFQKLDDRVQDYRAELGNMDSTDITDALKRGVVLHDTLNLARGYTLDSLKDVQKALHPLSGRKFDLQDKEQVTFAALNYEIGSLQKIDAALAAVDKAEGAYLSAYASGPLGDQLATSALGILYKSEYPQGNVRQAMAGYAVSMMRRKNENHVPAPQMATQVADLNDTVMLKAGVLNSQPKSTRKNPAARDTMALTRELHRLANASTPASANKAAEKVEQVLATMEQPAKKTSGLGSTVVNAIEDLGAANQNRGRNVVDFKPREPKATVVPQWMRRAGSAIAVGAATLPKPAVAAAVAIAIATQPVGVSDLFNSYSTGPQVGDQLFADNTVSGSPVTLTTQGDRLVAVVEAPSTQFNTQLGGAAVTATMTPVDTVKPEVTVTADTDILPKADGVAPATITADESGEVLQVAKAEDRLTPNVPGYGTNVTALDAIDQALTVKDGPRLPETAQAYTGADVFDVDALDAAIANADTNTGKVAAFVEMSPAFAALKAHILDLINTDVITGTDAAYLMQQMERAEAGSFTALNDFRANAHNAAIFAEGVVHHHIDGMKGATELTIDLMQEIDQHLGDADFSKDGFVRAANMNHAHLARVAPHLV